MDRKALNNFKWVSKKSSQRMTKYAYLSDEWESRGIFLSQDKRGYFAFDNSSGEEISSDIFSRTLTILNDRLNELNKDNSFFNNIDRWQKREQR